MEKLNISIKTEYIALNQLLKYSGIISTGGEVKFFFQENTLFYNGEIETRLRKKVYPGDLIKINEDYLIEVNSES